MTDPLTQFVVTVTVLGLTFALLCFGYMVVHAHQMARQRMQVDSPIHQEVGSDE